jgi:hypothetical protein
MNNSNSNQSVSGTTNQNQATPNTIPVNSEGQLINEYTGKPIYGGGDAEYNNNMVDDPNDPSGNNYTGGNNGKETTAVPSTGSNSNQSVSGTTNQNQATPNTISDVNEANTKNTNIMLAPTLPNTSATGPLISVHLWLPVLLIAVSLMAVSVFLKIKKFN